MRLRSITLDNVRRFTEPVTVGPIADGVTLLSEPNEAGKSTLFDALHALFFVKHRSRGKEIVSLRPHSGGKVAVECTLERDGASWRIHKQWLSAPEARVWRDGTLLHQGDAAEDWIAALVTGEAGGPGGLLWVRQGRVSLRADKPTDEKAELEKRRDLLTVVSGAMNAVTGGERMDRALDAARGELDRLQTANGHPRKHGRWAEAVTDVAALEAEEARLVETVEALRQDLDARRRLATDLSQLRDPDAAAAREEAVRTAQAAVRDAEARAREVAAAETRAALARQTWETARDTHRRAQTARADLAEAERALTAARAAQTTQEAKSRKAAKAHEVAQAQWRAAKDGVTEAQRVCRRCAARDGAAAAADERDAMQARIDAAEAAERRRIAAAAAARQGPDAATVERIEGLTREVQTQAALRSAGAARVSARYDPGARPVLLDGAPLDDGAQRPLPRDGRIVVPGIGTLRVALAGDDGGAALDTAQRALAEALAAGDWPDVDALRAAHRAREEAGRAATLAAGARDLQAPDGIAALRERHAELSRSAQVPDDDLPTSAEADAALATAEAALTDATAADEKARELRQAANLAAARAEAAAESVQERRDAADAAVRELPPHDPAAEAERLEALRSAAERAARDHADLAAETPDLDALRTRLDRVTAVRDRAKAEEGRIAGELGKLDGRIETRAEEGVEEALAEVRGRLSAARDALHRIAFEVDTLRRLCAALDTAQKAARLAYFEPVARELRPLLSALWDDVDLVWSDDTLLPDALVRRGTEEPIDVLSGGTQEQIAFLVRLAFARLLAKTGRAAPLILDDALVYSDDDRIEKMFDALHGAAADLQILVLSCRQRAFQALGAPTLTFRPASAELTGAQRPPGDATAVASHAGMDQD
ncbi:chromosome segregation protein SMC [Rhodobacteraceae bacterium CCMM004]|nr:chromosome segregation protein SMC [Rhodobacteraceae bacterium CCMM004]